jgi:ATP-dependent Clp protease adapter protein ClpS
MFWLRRLLLRLGVSSAPPPVILPTTDSLTSIPGFVPAGFRFGIEIFNDNSTPMEFVVSTLGEHLGLSYHDAARAMLAIHSRGGALFATSSYADAQRIATAITAEATQHNHALLCRAVSVST